MFRISPVRTLTLLTLLSLGGSEAADAAPRPAAHRTSGGFWSLETTLWPFLAVFRQKSGCTIDPEGQCESRSRAAVTAIDEGCKIDPFGRCESQPQAAITATDAGCMIDPEGQCKR
jgi:hypothetical protein